MKIISSKILSIITILLTFVGTSCKKGDTGAPGNANVVASTYFAGSSTWSFASSSYEATFNVPALTASVQNSGTVQVFFSSTGYSTWRAVPFTYHNPIAGSNNYFMDFTTSVGYVSLFWTYDSNMASGSEPNAVFGATCLVKVVVIPPAAMKPQIDLHNYEEVKAAYNLKD
jgi:hypothetical protein